MLIHARMHDLVSFGSCLPASCGRVRGVDVAWAQPGSQTLGHFLGHQGSDPAPESQSVEALDTRVQSFWKLCTALSEPPTGRPTPTISRPGPTPAGEAYPLG